MTKPTSSNIIFILAVLTSFAFLAYLDYAAERMEQTTINANQ